MHEKPVALIRKKDNFFQAEVKYRKVGVKEDSTLYPLTGGRLHVQFLS